MNNTRRTLMIRVLPLLAVLMCAGMAHGQNIRWRYTGPQYFPPPGPLNNWCYVDRVGFDLLNYARDFATARGGRRSSVSVFLVRNNVYGWRMRYYKPRERRWVRRGFNMVDVARWQGQRNGYNRLPLRMRNWGVYFRNFRNPYSWKGAYWLSGCR